MRREGSLPRFCGFLRSAGFCSEGWCLRLTKLNRRTQRILRAKACFRFGLFSVQLALNDLSPEALLTLVGAFGAELVVFDLLRFGVDEAGHLPASFV